jgi:multiple sugar transport system permease protein/putative aldouronate transport system permease protein
MFTTEAYQIVFSSDHIYRAYGVTTFVTVVGTLLAMFLTITLAYPLSQKKVKFRNPVTFIVYFTMLFNGGLVPTYLLITRTLGLRDSIWVLILPSMFSAWNMFLMRNFFHGLPDELSESAYIDGANDFTILSRIILPVSTPGIATVSLFYALGFWNAWFNAMLYLNDRTLMPLQYLIMDLVRTADAIKEMARMTGIPEQSLPANALRMATTLVTVGPIILLYPFLQKYFTKGLTVGAIKG